MSLVFFYTTLKQQKSKGFLIFSCGTKSAYGMKWLNMPVVEIRRLQEVSNITTRKFLKSARTSSIL